MATQTQVLMEIAAERDRQDAKFGDQTRLRDRVAVEELEIYRIEADWCRSECQLHHATPEGATWTDILLEEVFEAVAEQDVDKLRAELVQVAAVAVAWIEALDKR